MQVFAFISGKGGVGKSTLTANVAVGLALRGKRVLVIDLDPQNIQRLHMGLDPEDIAGLVREGISEDSVFDSPFGVKFIPFGRVHDVELAEFEAHLRSNPDWVRQGIESLSSTEFDYVLLDTPPGGTTYLQQALHAANRAVVVLLADAASLVTVSRIRSLIEEHTASNAAFDGYHFLLNQMPRQSKLAHQVRNALIANYASLLAPVSVLQDIAVAQALAFERPVLHYEPNCPASLSIQSVADWIIDSAEAT